MSNTVIGIGILACGVLSALGATPIRLGTRPVNRYWERRPTKFTRLSCVGGAVFFVCLGALITWHDVMPEKYQMLFVIPAILGFVLGVAALAMDRQSNRTPSIAFLTRAGESARRHRASVNGWIIAAFGVLFLLLLLSLYFRY